MTEHTRLVAARTPNGETVVMSVVDMDGGADDRGRTGEEKVVAAGLPDLSHALRAIDDFTKGLRSALVKAAPDKTTVEFSVGFALQAGKITALFAEGSAEGSVTVTLEWERGDGGTDRPTGA